MEINKIEIIVASDTTTRDGIGIEIWYENKLIIEIFRDDSQKTRTATFYEKDIPLELMEKSIALFKKEIPWDFLDSV